MNEILQQRIEEAAKRYAWANDVKPLPTDKNTMIPIGEEVEKAVFFGAMFLLQNQWISVDDGLPNVDEEDKQYSINVFARTKDCIRYAYYDFYNESWCSVEGGYRFGGDVTHWMMIPTINNEEK